MKFRVCSWLKKSMFNSIRTKLTLWYLAILALVIVAFAASTYILIVRTLDKNLDIKLAEMAENFKVAVNAEQHDEDEKPSPEQTIQEAINEFRFQDIKFAVFSNDGKLIATTIEDEFPNPKPENSFSTIKTKGEIFRVFTNQLNVGQNQYKLFVYGSLRDQFRIKKSII